MDINDFQNLSDAEKAETTKKISRTFAKHIALQTVLPIGLVIATHLVAKKFEKNGTTLTTLN